MRNCRAGCRTSHCHFILQDKDQYPYHYSQVQGLMPHDYHYNLQYCKWLLQDHEHFADFLEHILWSDETAFTREGVFNSHNSPYGHSIISMQHVSGAIKFTGALMCGPVSLAIVWLGQIYCRTASVVVFIVCSCRKCYWCCLNMCHWWFDVTWFQHDGALAHFRAQNQQHLNTVSWPVARTRWSCIMACEITGPEPSGLLPLGTPERNCLQGSVTTTFLVMYLLCSVSASIVHFQSVVYPDMCELCIL
jgi:hypothetical protein